MIESIIYILIFFMGAFFGSFFTLAVYRIPLGQDITHEHSFCPVCKHKLKTLDLIPIFSYLFLGGKCRYCKNKIKPRYFLLEIFSGLVFLLFALSLKINLYNIEISKIITFGFFALYFTTLFIIAGIDKERITIQKSVLVFGIIIQAIYIIYLYIVQNANIYRYVIYLLIMLILIIIDTLNLRKKATNNYIVQILTLCTYIIIFNNEKIFILTIMLTVLSIIINLLINKILLNLKKYRRYNTQKKVVIPIGFYISVCNIITIIYMNVINNYNIF